MTTSQIPDVIVQARPLSSEGSIILIGFPGSGLVGSIALSYMVDKLGFDLIGTMTSKYFPPMAMMSDGVIAVPVRIYEKEKFVAILADIPIHPQICYEVANAILDWLAAFKIAEVVTLAGIITNEPEKRVFCVATDKPLLDRLGDSAIRLPIGSISGIASSLLTECKIRNIPGIGLLGETINAPDPRAAAGAIGVLNSLYDLQIDTAGLIEQAEEIEAQMHRLAEEVQTAEEQPIRKDQQLPMYG
ncbi:proteasome assembly chaperone family protein [Methanospirillum stamsii]|uniref:Proteasome assembly chaperone family protein n=1 Tax=Methanospirillum stamsii TaxID=1277351 RepID=A0A2V2MY40_9EURY|nr:proteasome assembly chaperone family protein [Methanospirillum stamsii]PWR70306.1 proteasome assembly chaperone family protein [Methanospirillum stamsii]